MVGFAVQQVRRAAREMAERAWKERY